jgi:hypothetical protein
MKQEKRKLKEFDIMKTREHNKRIEMNKKQRILSKERFQEESMQGMKKEEQRMKRAKSY